MKGLTSVDISYIQLLVFPLLLFVFYRFSFLKLRVPRLVLLAALLCAVFATAFSFTYLPARGGVFLVARLAGDSHEINSRLFRAKIHADASMLANSHRPAAVRRYFREISSLREAAEALKGRKDRRALVWGNRRWLNVSLKRREPKSLDELEIPAAHEWLRALRLVLTVPVIGLSYNPPNETGGFLALLFSGLAGGSRGTVLSPSQELHLRDAGEMVAAWTSFAHKAYPYLLLGNHYLAQAFSREAYQAGEMHCALRAYLRGLSFLRPGNNPDLEAALHNNLGVALAARYVMEEPGPLKKYPIKHFALAKKAGHALNRFGFVPQASVEAVRNVYLIRSLMVKGKKKNYRKARRKARHKARKAGKSL